MPEDAHSSDLYSQNIIPIQLAYQGAVLNNRTPDGGFMALMADLDAPLTRGIMKYFWCTKMPPPHRKSSELVDSELDSHRDMLESQGKPPLVITVVPRLGIYAFMRELTQSEQMVRTGGGRGKSLMSALECDPIPYHFHTLLIGRTGDDDGVVTRLVDTPL